MQRLIDADTAGIYTIFSNYEVAQQLMGVPTVLTIPDNPTNGDMIKALFSDVHYVLASQGTPRVVTNLGASFDLDWWNAPYKGAKYED